MTFQRWRARRRYKAALAVLTHAAVTRYRDVPASHIKALDALEHYRDAFGLEPADPFLAMDERRALVVGYAEPLRRVRDNLPPATEDGVQSQLVEDALARGRNGEL